MSNLVSVVALRVMEHARTDKMRHIRLRPAGDWNGDMKMNTFGQGAQGDGL
jgi:hypothetical protein